MWVSQQIIQKAEMRAMSHLCLCRCVRENTAGEDAFKDEEWESASDEEAGAAVDSDDD